MTDLEGPTNLVRYKYPDFSDLKFQKKITLKKEFDYSYPVPKESITSLNKDNKLCQQEEFTPAPHQEFIKNFIHPNTPYNGILLYHGMGTGKTCSSIGVTEQFRNLHKYNPNFNKIWIIASANVQDNFKLQLFDKDKLIQKNGLWTLDSCVGPNLLQELQNYDLQNMTKDMIAKRIQRNIDKHYRFLGYEKFANLIMKIVSNIKVRDKTKYKRVLKEKLESAFSNCMLVIDEAHNVRVNDDDGKKKIAKSIRLLTSYVKKNKLLLLTGTPMYNNSKEIIFLLNILRDNDGLSAIKISEIFDKNGELLKNEEGEEIGKKQLTMKANGYVSFVRGENPYIFPFKIYPSDYKSASSIKRYEYPTHLYNGAPITEKLSFLDLYVTKMSEFQRAGYEYFKRKLYNNIGDEEDDGLGERDTGTGYQLFQDAIYSLNICYPGNKEGEYLNGKPGLFSVVSKDSKAKFRYINKDNNIFNYEKIGEHSAKIKEILNIIINSTGTVLIYSQYKDAGLVPMALALEEIGLGRFNSEDNLFASSGRKSQKPLFKGKYSMITGDQRYSRDNSREIKIINKKENNHGELCKVVLITQAGSEGIDFKNLRQVHIIEPWFNLNRVDQIVGRAIRNCSHKDLPLAKRNCQIFMHGTYMDENEEAIDMMLYRKCEEKARKIGRVQALLKSISVDCIVNENQKHFSKLEDKCKIELSTKNIIKYQLKDKPYSLVCDYQEDCDYKCQNTIKIGTKKEDKSTYSYHHSVNNQLIEQIKRLFLKKHVYSFKEISSIFKNDDETIYSALTHLVKNKTELILDKFGKAGNVINVQELYVFQPVEFNDSYTTLYDKMRPLKLKPTRINVTQQIPKLIENKSNSNHNARSVVAVAGPNGSTVGHTNHLLEMMKNNYEIGMTRNGSLKDKNKDFYLNYTLIVEKMNELSANIEISESQKRDWLVEHLVEALPFRKELALVNYLFRVNETSAFTQTIKSYYEEKNIFDFLEGKLLFLIDLADRSAETGNKAHLYDSHIKLYYKPDTDGTFRPLTQSEKKEGQTRVVTILQKLKNELGKNIKYLVFIGHYEKDKKNPNQLKIKHVGEARKSKKNKGRVFKNEIPKDMFPILNDIIGEEIIVPRMFIKEQLTVVLEVISKYFAKKKNVVYLNKLQNAENNVNEL